MAEVRKPYLPDRWVAIVSFSVGVLDAILLPAEDSDLVGILIGIGLGAIIDLGVWRGRGWAFALNVLLGVLGAAFLYFEGVPNSLSWLLEVVPTVALVGYSLARLTNRLGPPPTGWRPYAPLGGRIDRQSSAKDS